MRRILEISLAFPLLFLTACSAMMPDLVKMVSEIEDTAVVVEVNRDAMQEDTDIHVRVDIVNKDPPRQKANNVN